VAVVIVLGGSVYGYRKLSGSACSGTVNLTVSAAPEIASAVQQQATEWTASARVDGSCVAVQVTPVDSADMSAAVATESGVSLAGVGQASGKIKVPDVWVADSSTWLLRLRAAKSDSVPPSAQPVAKSPVVLAMPEPIATTFGWPNTKLNWVTLLTKVTTDPTVKVGVVDPTRDASGLNGLLSMAAVAAAAGPNATQTATAVLRELSANSSSVRDEVLKRFPRASDAASLAAGLSAAPLSEQAVIAYNATQPPVRLAPLYVDPAPSSLDYPYVVMPATNGTKATAAGAFYQQLGTSSFRDKLATAGLRAADGSVGKGFQTPAGAPNIFTEAGAAPAADAIDTIVKSWLALSLPARMLAVLDVSGSMLTPVPTANGATRMQVTTEAARKGLTLFDDKWAVGLWTFSTLLDGPKDYKELVPIGPLSAQRPALLQSLAGIKPKQNGDTGLYDTIVAAYKAVQTGWDPGAVNSVMVMTDGQNDDPVGITIDQCVAQLKAAADPAKPIRVILIGIGTDASAPQMKQITDAIGGATFIAPDPAKIGEIFLQAMALRSTS
jgi:Ca-activated chloride channel family protein